VLAKNYLEILASDVSVPLAVDCAEKMAFASLVRPQNPLTNPHPLLPSTQASVLCCY